MAVQTDTSRVPYAGNGATTAFAVPFRFLLSSDLKVVLVDPANTATTQTLTTNYTVTGARLNAGGTVTMVVAPPAGYTLRIQRNIPVTQLIDYRANDPFPEESAEDGYDKVTMLLQQLRDDFNDALASAGANLGNSIIDTTVVLQLGQVRLLIPIKTIAGTTQIVSKTYESALSLCTNAAAVSATIRGNTGDTTLDFSTGCYTSFKQTTTGGVVTLVADTGVTFAIPTGYLAKTRALNSVITATCTYASTGSCFWTLSGDLAADPAAANTVRSNVTTVAFSSTSVTPAVVTGWNFPVTTGKNYRVNIIGTYQTAAVTTGGILAVATPDTAVGTVNGFARLAISDVVSATSLEGTLYALTGAGSSVTSTGVATINRPHAFHMQFTFVCTVTGTLDIRWGSEVAASAAQINAGSVLIAEVIPAV